MLRRLRNYQLPIVTQKSKILVEHIENEPHQIPLALLALAQQRVTPGSFRVYADPVRTDFSLRQSLQLKLKFFFRGQDNSRTESSYCAFGANNAIFPFFSRSVLGEARALSVKAQSDIKTKYDLETYRISGVLVGDLLYDEYLHRFNVGTVEVDDPRFRDFFHESMKIYSFWMHYFSNHKVAAVIGNSVYRQAIVARIALDRGVPVFDPQVSRVVRLEGDGCEYSDIRLYREEFASFDVAVQDDSREQARQALEAKVGGKPDLSTHHISNPNGRRTRSPLIRKTERPSVLIAPHCFSDSAHAYGKMLFPDFEEWLKFLAQVIPQTNYDWYLKQHPKGAQDLPVLREIFADCPGLRFLPHDASLLQLAEEGVSLVLTMRGHVALEMPLVGVPVISCAPGTRYRDYSFTHHAQSVSELQELLLDVERLETNIDVKEIEEFYFMDSIYNHPNIFFQDLLASTKRAAARGGGAGILREFSEETSLDQAQKIIESLVEFSNSRKLRYRPQAQPFTS